MDTGAKHNMGRPAYTSSYPLHIQFLFLYFSFIFLLFICRIYLSIHVFIYLFIFFFLFWELTSNHTFFPFSTQMQKSHV